MPSRADKCKEFSEWSFFFKTSVSAAKMQEVAKQLEQVGFAINHTGKHVLDISGKPLKYDTAISRITRAVWMSKELWVLTHRDQTESVAVPLESTCATVAEVEELATQSSVACERQLLVVRLTDLLHNGRNCQLDYVMGQKLGDGTFGKVFSDVGKQVAIKQFSRDHDALQEAAAHASIKPHPNIVELLNVGIHDRLPCLIFARHEGDLRKYAKDVPIIGPELRHIMLCSCEGVRHMHAHGIVHSDLKADNIFVSGTGLRDHAAEKSSPEFARHVMMLPAQLQVVIGDLGAARCGDPSQRCLDDADSIQNRGVVETTLWYRAPEVLAGRQRWSFPVDCWAVGCIGAELVLASPLFGKKHRYEMLLSQIALLGQPTTGNWLSAECPHYPRQCAKILATWPPLGLRDTDICAFLADLLVMDPEKRLTMSEAIQHLYFTGPFFEVSHALKPAGRGLVTIIEARLQEELTRYLQLDPWWSEIYARLAGISSPKKQCIGEHELSLGLKYEEAGYVSVEAPECKVIASLPAHELFGALRVVDFARVFMQLNDKWFREVTRKIRKQLSRMPADVIGDNGADFLLDCLSKTGLAYAIVQLMRPGERFDPKHYDGGASLLHMGLTPWGRRRLDCFFQDTTVSIEQSSGSIYMGNLCTVEHQVKHYDADAAAPLFQPEGRHKKDSKSFLVTVMFRCDIFRHSQSRQLKMPPTPADVYKIVNDIVAQDLAKYPLRVPRWEEVVARAAIADSAACASSNAAGGQKRKAMGIDLD